MAESNATETLTRWEGGWDTLGVTVSATHYYFSEGATAPAGGLVIRWFVDRHPCDGVPWLAGIGFLKVDELGFEVA